LICAGIVLGGAAIAYAGGLSPPVGPIAPTMKSLAEVEARTAINATNTPGDADSLFKITQPGAYYLTGNVQGIAAKHGIEIAASGVTLDLNGFDLLGAAGSLDGVSATLAGLTNIAVVNGSVRNWGGDGIDLSTVSAVNCRLSDVLASGNAGMGIRVSSGCTLTSCSARSNGGSGINTTDTCALATCSASYNTGNGINSGSACAISNCTAIGNALGGIRAGTGCSVLNGVAYLNGGVGLSASIGSTVSNCSAYQNTGNGISTSTGCSVSNCSAYLNTLSGISSSDACTIADCTSEFNTLVGIVCASSCLIRDNTCASNGNGGDGAGINAQGADNRIEGNNCTGADRGIDVDSPGNVVIRNTCSGNTIDWAIQANNVCGPIIDRRAPASAAISGFSAASSLGSTDPNANFSY